MVVQGELEVTRTICKFRPRVINDSSAMQSQSASFNKQKVVRETEILIMRYSSGQMVGEEDIIQNRPYSTTVTAVS